MTAEEKREQQHKTNKTIPQCQQPYLQAHKQWQNRANIMSRFHNCIQYTPYTSIYCTAYSLFKDHILQNESKILSAIYFLYRFVFLDAWHCRAPIAHWKINYHFTQNHQQRIWSWDTTTQQADTYPDEVNWSHEWNNTTKQHAQKIWLVISDALLWKKIIVYCYC